MSDSASSAREPGPRRPSPLMRVAGAVLVVLVAGGLLAGALGGSGSGPASATLSNLRSAAYVAAHGPGYRFTMNIDESVAGKQVAIAGEGSIDEQTKQGSMQMSAAGQAFSEILSAPYVYVQLPAADASALPGARPWLKANITSFAQSIGASGSLSDSGGPSQFIEFLKASSNATVVGHEAVRGQPATHYHALIDLSSLASSLPAKDGNGPRARALNGGVSAPAGLR